MDKTRQELSPNSSKKNNKAKEVKPSLLTLLAPYKVFLALLIALSFLANMMSLIAPKIIAIAIDSFSKGKFNPWVTVEQFLAIAFLGFLFTYLQGILQTYVSEKVAKDLRNKLSDQISRQSHAFVESTNPSKILTFLTADVDSIKQFVSQALVSITSSLFIIIGASVLLLSINWKLALTIIAIIPLIATAFAIVLLRVRDLFKKSREILDALNKVITESILGSALIRVVNSQAIEFQKFLDNNIKAKTLGLSILKLFAGLIPIIVFVSNLGSLTILLLGGSFVIHGSMSLGEFTAFNSYLALLIFPILIIGFMSSIIAQASASYGRIYAILNAPMVAIPGKDKKALMGKIEFKNITVMYGQKPVLKNISFTIHEGSKVAIIGPTAAGKTQILYLLTGLTKPNSGEVLFDGKNFEEFEPESFYEQIGFVFQDSILFNLSLRENIAFNDKVTDQSLTKAIQTAELKEFVESLPQKLDTKVSERGTSLSGGQKQRIMLARALAVNPKILLLDDFTARVDASTEGKILHNIELNFPGITLVSVTQKISTAMDYDQIILLMQGEIIAQGTHQQLLETCPEYIQIFQSQKSTHNYELQS